MKTDFVRKEREGIRMSDLISRQAAIDEAYSYVCENCWAIVIERKTDE